jgi:rhamnosyltransferase
MVLNSKMLLSTSRANTNNKPRVAILLAAFNGIDWIEEQINSILNQEDVNIEIFISVDLSIDGTYELCKSLEKKNKSVIILPYGNRFGNAAKNFFRLIRDTDMKKYNYIAFSDQDDIWNKKKIYRAVSQMNKYKYDAYSSDFIAFWSGGKEKYIKKSWPQKKYDYFFESAGPGCTYVFKTEALEKFKFFLISNWVLVNKVSLHDWIIYAYFRNHKFNWKIDSVSLIKYRQHASNEFGSNSDFKAYIKRIFLIKNNWYQKEVEKIKNLLESDLSLNFYFRIKNFWQLRRSPRDALLFLIISIIGFY